MSNINNINLNGTEHDISIKRNVFEYEYSATTAQPGSVTSASPTNALPENTRVTGVLHISSGPNGGCIHAFEGQTGYIGVYNPTQNAINLSITFKVAYEYI